MNNEEFQNQLLKKLDILISLQLDKVNSEEAMPVSMKVKKLSDSGLTPTEIAVIIGKKTNYVTATLSNLKKADKRDGKKKKNNASLDS